MLRTQHTVAAAALTAALGWITPSRAQATPYRLTPADRTEITALVRTFFEATRDDAPAQTGVYPTREELRGMFPAEAAGPAGAPTAVGELVGRHLSAIERDARELRARFHAGVFVRVSGPVMTRGVIDLRRCGRFARPETQCGDGPLVEYTVGAEARRLRLDTLVRLNGHWRIFDARP